MITNATLTELDAALRAVNKKYDNNIQWNRAPEGNVTRPSFTLRVKDSTKAGHRRGQPRYEAKTYNYGDVATRPGRRLINACWHVHGDFFDALFKENPNAWIRAGTQKITKERGNWEDRNIGSQMNPFYFSEACDCTTED